MNRLAEDAQNLLDSAIAAVRRGESCQETTILIGCDGGIQMCADSDWPLDSLMLDRGAKTGYRVSPRRSSVRVEGREGSLRCVLEAVLPNQQGRACPTPTTTARPVGARHASPALLSR